MNCTKQIILTGYRVRYADLRAPKPRLSVELLNLWNAAGEEVTPV